MDHDEFAQLIYTDAGREITQQFSTMATNVTLASGALATLLAVLGAGELFAAHGANGKGSALSPDLARIPRLSSVSLVVLALTLPLLVRFLIRSTIAYQNLLRFQDIQRESRDFLLRHTAFDRLKNHVQVYLDDWRSPKSLHELAWRASKYTGFPWVLLVATAALSWAFVTAVGVAPRLVAAGAVVVGLGLEAFTLADSRKRYFVVPNAAETVLLNANPPANQNAAGPVVPPVPGEWSQLDEQRGLFLGRRRSWSRGR